ncbi:MAG: hypothetical protein ABIT07_08735, partial [Ferruginibacter sp.]
LPGDYTVKVKVGDKSYDSKLQLKADDRPNYNLADRQAQFASAMVLYNMHEQLAALVDDVSGKQKNLKLLLGKLQNPKTKVVVQQYYDSLENLRSTLMGTKQTSIFADEERLREKISELYISLANQEVRPSNLQEERVKGLQLDLKKGQEKNAAITKTFSDKVKAIQEAELPKSKVDLNKGN